MPLLPPFLSRHLRAGTLLLLVGAGLSGCANTYRVRVDALCNPNVTAPTTYRLVARDDVKADFDPAFATGVALMDAALARRGFVRAVNPQDAEMEVEIDFGLGHRRKRAIHEDDLIANGIRRSAITRANTTAVGNNPGTNPPPEPAPFTRVTVINVYEKFLSLSARETPLATRGLRKPVELWRIDVALEETEIGLDECLPVLVAAAVEKVGTSTITRENIRVVDRDHSAAGPILAENRR